MRQEKEELLNKLLEHFEKDKHLIIENIKYVMENICLVAESENYKATILIKLDEKNTIDNNILV